MKFKELLKGFPIEIYINKEELEAIFIELKLDIIHLCGLNVETFWSILFVSHSVS